MQLLAAGDNRTVQVALYAGPFIERILALAYPRTVYRPEFPCARAIATPRGTIAHQDERSRDARDFGARALDGRTFYHNAK